MSFTPLGLQDSLLRAVDGAGYTQPTPIQAQAIPAILSGNDVMAAAQTGTGKTAGFTLPLLQLLGKGQRAGSGKARALVLTPTRELAAQVEDSVRTYGTHENLRSVVVFGGVNIRPQLSNLRKGADILVATPGRLLDLYQQKAVDFSSLEVLIMDEADRMLDMGFINDIRRIMKLLPKQRQNLMFSATFSNEIRTLAKTICHNPVEIDVAPRNSTVEAISQRVYLVNKPDKIALLSTLCRTTTEQSLVFSRTKHGANKLVKCLMKDGIKATAIHGNKSQSQRTKALADFKANRVQVMVATDIAARGIDIDDLAQVINFDLPNVSEDYVHRIGRTGRAGAEGLAISLVAQDEKGLLRDIERLIKRKIEKVDLPEFSRPVNAAIESEETTEKRYKDPRKPNTSRSNNNKKRRGSGNKPAAKATGQSQKRHVGSGNTEGDTTQKAAPKRRRRVRSKKISTQGSNQSGNSTKQSEKSGNTVQGDSQSASMIRNFFGGKKVA